MFVVGIIVVAAVAIVVVAVVVIVVTDVAVVVFDRCVTSFALRPFVCLLAGFASLCRWSVSLWLLWLLLLWLQ